MIKIYLVTIAISKAFGYGCYSSYDATYCSDPKCCDSYGNCASVSAFCRYYASDCNYFILVKLRFLSLSFM